jgi:hypothetical protein
MKRYIVIIIIFDILLHRIGTLGSSLMSCIFKERLLHRIWNHRRDIFRIHWLEHLQEFAKFYLANLVFCQLLKRYVKKKRVHLQQFDIIHLPNPDLIYIRNYVYALPPFGNLYQESFSILDMLFLATIHIQIHTHLKWDIQIHTHIKRGGYG